MADQMTSLLDIQKAIETRLDSTLTRISDEKASKADLLDLRKSMDNLKATLAAREEDVDRETKGWSNAVRKSWKTAVYASLVKGHPGFANNKDLRSSYLTKANINEEDANSGLGMLPTMVDGVIQKLLPLYGVARQHCRVIAGVHGSINLNAVSAYPSFAFTARGDSTVTPTAPTYANTNVQPKQASGITTIEEKLIWDSVPGVLEDAAENLAASAGLLEDQVLFVGDGTSAYAGFTGLTTNANVGQGGTAKVTVTAAAFTNFDPLIACTAKVAPIVARSPNCAYHMNVPVFAALQQLKSGSTVPLYYYDISVNSWKLSGFPIVFNQAMTAQNLGYEGSGGVSCPVIFGDLRRAITMVTGREIELRTLMELYAASNQIGLRLTYDYNMGLILPGAYTRVEVSSSS